MHQVLPIDVSLGVSCFRNSSRGPRETVKYPAKSISQWQCCPAESSRVCFVLNASSSEDLWTRSHHKNMRRKLTWFRNPGVVITFYDEAYRLTFMEPQLILFNCIHKCKSLHSKIYEEVLAEVLNRRSNVGFVHRLFKSPRQNDATASSVASKKGARSSVRFWGWIYYQRKYHQASRTVVWGVIN